MRPRIKTFTVLALTVAGLLLHSVDANAESRRSREKKKVRPVVRATFDKTAEKVELFDGMKEGTLETKVVAMGPSKGYVVVGNTTDKPITVEFPHSFVTVPTEVLKQFGGGGFGGGQQGGGFGGGQQGGGGQQQNQGGGLGGQQGGQQGFGGGQQGGGQGNGFFSIPPEKAIKINYISACLNHGKPDPNPRVDYSIIPVDMYTKDPILKELIYMVGSGRLPQQAAQAAVWARTDNMSWQQLAMKTTSNLVGRKIPYFSQRDIAGAQQIAAMAVGQAKERSRKQPATEPKSVPVRTSLR